MSIIIRQMSSPFECTQSFLSAPVHSLGGFRVTLLSTYYQVQMMSSRFETMDKANKTLLTEHFLKKIFPIYHRIGKRKCFHSKWHNEKYAKLFNLFLFCVEENVFGAFCML